MMVEMLGNRMMVMTGVRRTMITFIVNRKVGVAGVRRLRPLRFRVMLISMNVGRDLEQVRHTHDQGYAQPEATLESGIVRFHGAAKLAADTPSVNASAPTSWPTNHPILVTRTRRRRSRSPLIGSYLD